MASRRGAFNFHYQADGYHPLVCFDGTIGDLLKAELKPDAMYCRNGASTFMKPLMEEYLTNYPETALFMRGDAGFATDELYSLRETHGTSYAIRMIVNNVLKKLMSELDSELYNLTQEDTISYVVVYGEFEYKANSWCYPRRIICKVEKTYGEMIHIIVYAD